jgi:glycosyltransferase involved in cell wall biosynthesis
MFAGSMNICIISSAFPSKRDPIINIFIYQQAKELANRGHKVFVVAGDTESRVEGDLAVYARPGSIKSTLLALKMAIKIPGESFWLFKNVGIRGTVGRLALVKITCDILEQEKIDVVDGHWAGYGAIVAYLVSKMYKSKYIVTYHGSDIACGENDEAGILPDGRKEIVSVELEKASCVIVDSQSISNDVIRYSSNKPLIVYHAVDLSRFKPISTRIFKKKTIISVGSLTKRKGHEYLLGAIAKVLEINRDIDFLIIGRGPEEANLKKLAEKLNILNNVTFIEYLSDDKLPLYYSSSEFFVLATLHEGFGIVLAEAMACGIPVVSTNVAAVPEVVGDGGILIEPKNIDQLAGAMLKLLNDESFRQELSRKALAQARKFSFEKRIDRIEEIYETCRIK